jgi:TIR domain
MNAQLPPKCFISHAYADAIARDRLIKSLSSDVEAIVFPPITVPPDQFVSNRLIESLLSCDGLIYLTGGASDRSFWVAFERDYALRAGKQVFSADVHTLNITNHTGNALDLAVFASYHRQDRARVREVADFLNRERYFDLWLDVQDLQAGGSWQEEISHALEDRLKRGYVVAFWSRSASASQFIREELQRAATEISDFNDRVLFALLEDVPLPDLWLRFHEPAVQVYGNAERSTTQRLDDLMVRLYWLIYRKTRHRDLA